MAMEIRLNRVSRVYRPGELVSGVVIIGASKKLGHSGLVLRATGKVVPQVSAATVGIFEAFYSSVKPVDVFREEVMLTTEDIPSGRTEVPFEVMLEAMTSSSQLPETYHGVYINVVYQITVEMIRSGFSRNMQTDLEFVVEVPCTSKVEPIPLDFSLSPDMIENIRKSSLSVLPPFMVKGRLNQTNAFLDKPFVGEVIVESSEALISSIELQLVRVETVSYAEGSAKEATEIQNLQLAEGDPTRNLAIPIYMLFPRLFTCPTSKSDNFSVEFEVNINVVFEDGFMVTENFPITLVR